jgi:hypothetical protein
MRIQTPRSPRSAYLRPVSTIRNTFEFEVGASSIAQVCNSFHVVTERRYARGQIGLFVYGFLESVVTRSHSALDFGPYNSIAVRGF